MVRLEGIDIDLDNTFQCGQTFRWRRRDDGSYLGNVDGRAVRAELADNALVLHGALPEDEGFWRRYFDADSDYPALLADMNYGPLREAMEACPGLRVLDQPFFETLCCFIISANNNIARITRIVDKFCQIGPLDPNGLHAFPTPEQVLAAGREWVDTLGAGYRAAYLWEAAQRMAEGFDWAALREMDYETACEAVRQFRGVGEKVADCVLLFSCGHREAFPVDTWVEKLLTQWYGMKGTRSALKRQAMQRFGAYGGVAQQVLFLHAMRCKIPKK